MRLIIKKVPIPMAGVMLGFASLGNLLQSYSEGIRGFCGLISGALLTLLILKVVMFKDMIKEDMKNPIMASVSGTFSMGIILLSTYLKPYLGNGALYIWYFGILLHIVLIIYFTKTFILKFDLKKVFASYFIVYVGIVVASITAPAFGKQSLGEIIFWFGFISFIVLFFVVTKRYMTLKDIPDPAKPLFCIFAAPLSLCLAGYIQSVEKKSIIFLYLMLACATILYLNILFNLIGLLKLKFYPSYAAFTFPFIISAIATKQSLAFSTKNSIEVFGLKEMVLIETLVATALSIYVLFKFILFLIPNGEENIAIKA